MNRRRLLQAAAALPFAQTALASCPMTQPFATHFDLVLGPAAGTATPALTH